eukprot:TRINITY_DN721_c0_g1_i1.p3 TRINITY_DN721_c0_g1~~TRINITY_DN721_c0_g1_i1.p3  ORF type:complete len:112 (+),score=39.80 TRINITY_DN721_c0_g1_i1:297-632(+)
MESDEVETEALKWEMLPRTTKDDPQARGFANFLSSCAKFLNCILVKRHLSRIVKDMEEAESAEDVLPPESSSFEVNPSEEIEHVLRTLNLHDSEMTDEVPSCSLDKVVLEE